MRAGWPLRRSAGTLSAILALSGCAVTGYPAGGGSGSPAPPGGQPGAPVDLSDPSSIPDAVPKQESLSPYGNRPEYEVRGRTYHVLSTSEGYDAEGMASWYGSKFQGQRTSSGETFDMYKMTAAHCTLPLPTYVEVTNLENGRKAVVRINDRGPFRKDRLIDLSYVAALKLGIVGSGTARVRVRAVGPVAR